MSLLTKYIDKDTSFQNLIKDFKGFVLNGYSFSTVVENTDEFDIYNIVNNVFDLSKHISSLMKLSYKNSQISTYFLNEVLEDMGVFFKNVAESKRGYLRDGIPVFKYSDMINMFDDKNMVFDNNHTEILGHYLRVLEDGGFDKLNKLVSYEIDENVIKDVEKYGIDKLPIWYLITFILSTYGKEIGVPVIGVIFNLETVNS